MNLRQICCLGACQACPLPLTRRVYGKHHNIRTQGHQTNGPIPVFRMRRKVLPMEKFLHWDFKSNLKHLPPLHPGGFTTLGQLPPQSQRIDFVGEGGNIMDEKHNCVSIPSVSKGRVVGETQHKVGFKEESHSVGRRRKRVRQAQQTNKQTNSLFACCGKDAPKRLLSLMLRCRKLAGCMPSLSASLYKESVWKTS